MSALSRLPSERVVFYLMLPVALLPVWSAGMFFVTGDGPCHVYNARVLLDFWRGRHLEFYDPFYFLNTNLDPNWLSHLALAGLQLVFSPAIAEKVFLSGYVLLFGFGWRFLLRQLHPGGVFLSSMGLLFVWHHLLLSGFYNYALSIALFFWIAGFWWRWRENWTPGRLILLAILWLLIYLAHPMGLMFSLIFAGSALLWEGVITARRSTWKAAWPGLRVQALNTLLAALPMLALLASYFIRKPWGADGNSDTVSGLLNDLLNLKNLIVLDSEERDVVKVIAVMLWGLLGWAIWRRIRQRRWLATDFLFLFLAFGLWQYFQQGGARSLELLMSQRIQLFIFLGVLLWVSTADFPERTRRIVPILALALLVALLWVRIPIHRMASALVEDYFTATGQIEDESVVLVLNYDFGGQRPSGRELANRNWLFIHAADYIGAYRTAIMSDNYEALRHYFPFIWRGQRNMFVQTDKDGINFDNRPPRADIKSFKRRTEGYDIDYVLLVHYDQRFYDHQYSREIIGQLEEMYDFVFRSPKGKLEVFRLRR